MRYVVTAALCLLQASFTLAQIQPVVTDSKGQGNIDWSERTIIATGIGAPNTNQPQAAQRPGAIKAAQMIALRNALETIKGINLNSSTTVQNYMTESDVVTTNVSGFIKGFQQEGRTKYMSDGSVEVTMKIPLDGIGGIGDMLLGSSIADQPSVSQFEGTKAKNKTVFSGLVIDCKGLAVKPALSPRILDETGKEVYGSAYVSREWAVKYGIVGYSKEVGDAAKLDRVGKEPGQIKAKSVTGDNSTDIVITNDDAADVRSAAQNLKFLSECRVVLVID